MIVTFDEPPENGGIWSALNGFGLRRVHDDYITRCAAGNAYHAGLVVNDQFIDLCRGVGGGGVAEPLTDVIDRLPDRLAVARALAICWATDPATALLYVVVIDVQPGPGHCYRRHRVLRLREADSPRDPATRLRELWTNASFLQPISQSWMFLRIGSEVGGRMVGVQPRTYICRIRCHRKTLRDLGTVGKRPERNH